MSENNIADFFASIGIKTDDASAKRASDLLKKTEADITKAAAEGSEKRDAIEQQATGKRLSLVQAFGRIFLRTEQDRADRATKIRKDEAGKDERLQDERSRKASERRTVALRELQTNATRMAAFALKSVAAIEGVALGIVAATDKAAQSLERLNYTARNAGATPASMTAAGYAASQLGSSRQASDAAIDSFGKRLKNPGYAAALSSFLGKPITDANGKQLDTGDLLADFGDKLREVQKAGGPNGRQQALAYARRQGIDDENEINAIEDPRYRGLQAEERARQAKFGADPNAAAADGTKFEQAMRRVEQMAEDIRTKISDNLFKELTPKIDELGKFIDAHGTQISNFFDRAAKDIVAFAEAVSKQLAKVDWDGVLTGIENFASKFDATAKKYFGDTGTIAVAFTLFGGLILSKVLGPLKLVLSTLGAIGGNTLVARLLSGTSRVALGAATSAAGVTGAVAAGAIVASTAPANKDEPVPNADGSFRYTVDGKPASREEYLRVHGRGDLAGDGVTDGNALHRNEDTNYNGLSKAWNYLKSKIGMGDADPKKNQVQDAIIQTAEATKKLADNAGLGGGEGSGGGSSGSGASLGDRLAHGKHNLGGGGWKGNYGQKGWWTPEKQSHAVDSLMKSAGISEDGAKALVARWTYVESAGGPTAVNPNSGAEGIAQWLGSRKGDGSGGSFDEQLAKVAKELNSTEGKAKVLLNTRGSEARGASAYERAEGWNAATSTDNFTSRVQEGMKHITHGPVPSATATAPVPASTSEKAVTEQEAMAAYQRLTMHGQNPKDRALYDRWLKEQNTPKPHAMLDTPRMRSAQNVVRRYLASGAGLPGISPHAHLSAATRTAINNSSSREFNLTHNPTYNMTGGDPNLMLADAHRLAGRGQADLVRNMSVMES